MTRIDISESFFVKDFLAASLKPYKKRMRMTCKPNSVWDGYLSRPYVTVRF